MFCTISHVFYHLKNSATYIPKLNVKYMRPSLFALHISNNFSQMQHIHIYCTYIYFFFLQIIKCAPYMYHSVLFILLSFTSTCFIHPQHVRT